MGPMTKLYKLTHGNNRTYGECLWIVGVENGPLSGEGPLCGPGWFHAYTDPYLAVLLNPIHGNYPVLGTRLWEAEGDVGKEDNGLKVGCTRLRIIRRIPSPVFTLTQLITIAILVAKKVNHDKEWNEWADKWLSGEDQTSKTAKIVADKGRVDTYYGNWSTTESAAWFATSAAAEVTGHAVPWIVARAIEIAARDIAPLGLLEIVHKVMGEQNEHCEVNPG